MVSRGNAPDSTETPTEVAYRRGRTRPKTQDGRSLRRYRRRWKVERLVAWLGNFRRLS